MTERKGLCNKASALVASVVFMVAAGAGAEQNRTLADGFRSRGFAIAEVLWTYPDPKKRNFEEFSVRAAEYRRRLIKKHVNCAPLK